MDQGSDAPAALTDVTNTARPAGEVNKGGRPTIYFDGAAKLEAKRKRQRQFTARKKKRMENLESTWTSSIPRMCPELPSWLKFFVVDVPGRRLHQKRSRGVYTGIIGEMG